jgi:hypothetical protein
MQPIVIQLVLLIDELRNFPLKSFLVSTAKAFFRGEREKRRKFSDQGELFIFWIVILYCLEWWERAGGWGGSWWLGRLTKKKRAGR